MENMQRRLIPEGLQKSFVNLLKPLVKLFIKWNLNPNSLTLAGVAITSMAALAFIMGKIRLGGLLILLGGLCDAIDGNVARSASKATSFGALFDSTVDRYSEFIMFFGIAAYFVFLQDYQTLVAVFLALCGSIMVSYARARAEGLGLDAKGGMMQRPERIVFLGVGALIHVVAFEIAIWVVAVFANYTALQRIRCAYKQDSARLNQEAVIKPWK
ncbi:MAG: CDP-alcohol phosphatidyltransferase family protein [Desulfobacterales bacterium]|nr:MAG: CDP-alcohol phosphatidyltransferase family protein [Desulfobacterales bacterium]